MNWDKIYWKLMTLFATGAGSTQLLHLSKHDEYTKVAFALLGVFSLLIICVTFAYCFDRKKTADVDITLANKEQTEELKTWIDKRINGKLEKIAKKIDSMDKYK